LSYGAFKAQPASAAPRCKITEDFWFWQASV